VERGHEEAKVTEFGPSIVGFAIGLIAASALLQLMKALLFGVSPLDPWTFITVPLVLTAAAVPPAISRPTARLGSIPWWPCGTNEECLQLSGFRTPANSHGL
jgi:hypothetical protein